MSDYNLSDIIQLFNNQDVLTRKEYTYIEYVETLKKFQSVAATCVCGQADAEVVKLNEVIAKMESCAREKNMEHDRDVVRGIQAMKLINKEIAISMAGKKGEDRVANTFQYVNRADASFFRNVYISNDENETELDAVVLTSNGILIIEIKNAREDITIAEDGRILYDNASCYHDISIGEKLAVKERLLRQKLQNELKEKDKDIEVVVDSLLVFSTPKGVRIRVSDKFRQVNYCFGGSLYYRIDSYDGGIAYDEEELSILSDMLKNSETEQKRFSVKFDPEEIKLNFAKAYIALNKTVIAEDTEPDRETRMKKDNRNVDIEELIQMAAEEIVSKKTHKKFGKAFWLGTTAAAVVGVIVPGIVAASGIIDRSIRG